MHERTDSIHDLWIFVLEHLDDLFQAHNNVISQLLQRFVECDSVAADGSIHQAYLVPWFIELLVEGHKVIDLSHPILKLCDGGRDLAEKFLLIK